MLLQNGEHAIPLLANSFDEYLESNEYTFVDFVSSGVPWHGLLLIVYPPLPWPPTVSPPNNIIRIYPPPHEQYAPWCVWCQRLGPTWEAFAEHVEEQKIPVKIAKVRTKQKQDAEAEDGLDLIWFVPVMMIR